MGPHEGISALTRRVGDQSLLSLSCEDTAKRWPRDDHTKRSKLEKDEWYMISLICGI